MTYGHSNRQLVMSKLLVIALLMAVLLGIGFAPAIAGYREIRDENVSPFDAKDKSVDVKATDNGRTTVDINLVTHTDKVVAAEAVTPDTCGSTTWINRDAVRHSVTTVRQRRPVPNSVSDC